MIDLALAEHHNVYDDGLIKTIVTWIQAGAIAAMLIAPPCETWSNARTLECDIGNSPRPLRTCANPLCIPGLESTELQPLEVSNYLLYVAIELMLHCAFTGTPATMEHPKEPKQKEAPSIWRLPWLRHLETARVMTRSLLWQAQYGAVSAKPTHFMTCGIPDFKNRCKRFERSVVWSELEVLRGKDSSGAWNTAKGKEYPNDLNRALATVHVEMASKRQLHANPDIHEMQKIDMLYSQLYAGDRLFSDQVMAPDYHGGHVFHTMD